MEENLFDGHTGKSAIFMDRNAITPHYIPKKIPYREKEISAITSILKNALSGQKPDNLFVYGKTGTGKTTTSKFVLNQLQEYADRENAPVATLYLNCRNYNSKYKVMAKVVQIFYPESNFIGYSSTFIYEKMMAHIGEKHVQLVVGLDEIDKVKDPDDLVYTLTRANDELHNGSVSILGISNQLTFKDMIDPRTKSSLCQKEFVFPPYNADELAGILRERAKAAFNEGTINESAITLAAGIAAKESGDARTAVMLLLRAAEIAEKEGKAKG